jgi:hypothetical protein
MTGEMNTVTSRITKKMDHFSRLKPKRFAVKCVDSVPSLIVQDSSHLRKSFKVQSNHENLVHRETCDSLERQGFGKGAH